MLDTLVANWPLKLLALVLAFAIWVSVTGENRVVQDFKVPLEVRLPASYVLASHPPTTVDVRLRGAESVMRRLEPLPMLVRVDLDDPAVGTREVLLSETHLSGVPKGVDVDFIDPSRTTITIEERSQREVTLEPTFLGQPAEGFTLYNARLSPSRVRVEGPVSDVDRLEVLRTTPIRLDGRSEPFVARVSVVPEGDFVRLMDSMTVNVRVVVDMAAVERPIKHIPIGIIGAGPGTTVAPSAVDVILSGPPRLLDLIDGDQVRPTVDAGQVATDSGRTRLPIRIDLEGLTPDERSAVSIKSLSPRDAIVTVSGGRSL
ncbi:MAG TPA: CdaR family protein [Candidatus Polarisedimenticolaceae bacterium]|nr:CdaR family protein [Candidatus Polarisedimenticolaceae bacterium]